MQIIYHRRNTVQQLQDTSHHYGVEIDVRSFQDDLILEHDPFTSGTRFESWLENFRHQTLIVNIKEEGLETHILALLERYQIENYFFLDQSFPFLIKFAHQSHRRSAIRISEFESIHTAFQCVQYASWIWLDCFTKFPIDGKQARALQAEGYRLCAVSPELQGQNAKTSISQLAQFLKQEGILLNAVCTKHPDIWEELAP